MRKSRNGALKRIVFVTKNAQETKRAAALLAKEILKKKLGGPVRPNHPDGPRAFLVGLIGDLGSGKTTFAQGFAEGLGVGGSILSPTFVLMRQYAIHNSLTNFSQFVHIDCYRLNDQKDLVALGWQDLRADPTNLILVEWADRIKNTLFDYDLTIAFDYGTKTTRIITISKRERA